MVKSWFMGGNNPVFPVIVYPANKIILPLTTPKQVLASPRRRAYN